MMTLGELEKNMKRVNEWSLEGNSIIKDYIFRDFKEAMVFVNKVAEIAEKNNHHPDIKILYCNVRLSLTTHEAKGLTNKDFEVAEEIDKLG